MQRPFAKELLRRAEVVVARLAEEHAASSRFAGCPQATARETLLRRLYCGFAEGRRKLLEELRGIGFESNPCDFSLDEFRSPPAAVDPSLLGTLLERLRDDRRETGVFYTPRPLAISVCRGAIAELLISDGTLTADGASRFVDSGGDEPPAATHRAAVALRLSEITVMDPACGGGVLLVAMLHELLRLLKGLGEPVDAAAVARRLHGVDIDPLAVLVTRMRLWLALSAAGHQPPPLGEFECCLRVGDALGDLSPPAAESGTPSQRGENGRLQFIAARPAAFAGGFDLVVSNPPFVDAHAQTRQGKAARRRIKERFSTARGAWDLYVPFWERSLELLRRGGVASLITPNKWLSVGYGRELRRLAGGRLRRILDLTGQRAVAGAGVALIVATIGEQEVDAVTVQRPLAADAAGAVHRIPSRTVQRQAGWGMLLSPRCQLVLRLMEGKRRLADVCSVEEAFAVDEAYRLLPLLREERGGDSDTDCFRLLTTGGIDPFVSLWGRRQTRYLGQRFERPVVSRSELRRLFPRRAEVAEGPKIVLSGMRHFEAFLDERGHWLPAVSTVVVRGFASLDAAKLLLGLLNSSLAGFFLAECYGSLAVDGGVNFSRLNVSEIPIPPMQGAAAADLAEIVGKLLRRVKSAENADDEELRRRLDEAVFRLHGLSEVESREIRSARSP